MAPYRYDATFFQHAHQTLSFRVLTNSLPAARWTANSPYVVGDFVVKVADDGSVFMAVVAGTSHATTEPVWPTIIGAKVTDNTVTWMKVAAQRLIDTVGYTAVWEVRDAPNGVALMAGDTTNGRAEVGFAPGKWAVNTAYALGQQVVPTTTNGYLYQVETAGTSHAATEPTWPVPSTVGVYGAMVTDNTVKWRLISDDSSVSNLRIQLTPTYTDVIVPWGQGVWIFDLLDAFSKRLPILWGLATLSGRIT
jgi:hypothetical protein